MKPKKCSLSFVSCFQKSIVMKTVLPVNVNHLSSTSELFAVSFISGKTQGLVFQYELWNFLNNHDDPPAYVNCSWAIAGQRRKTRSPLQTHLAEYIH